MNQERKNKVIGKINELKSNIETFISDVNVNDLKTSFNLMIKDAQKDFNALINRDLDNVKKRLQKEKTDFEAKAKNFLDNHKKELTLLQSKIDKLVKSASQIKEIKKKTVAKSSAPIATSKKKILKKVAKNNSKSGVKQKTSKKST